jgi:hypothetical protein
MAQRAQVEATPAAGGGEPGGTAGSEPVPGGGGFGNATTIILIAVAAAFFWWSMRRRRAMEERMQVQRRQETIDHAEQSARNVANIMRGSASPQAAAAAASEGLAAAARVPVATSPISAEAWPPADGGSLVRENGAAVDVDTERALVIERAEAAAQAERTAAEQAERAARQAETAGESEARRIAAAEAASEEARADTADALRSLERQEASELRAEVSEPDATAVLRAAMADLDREAAVPLGAVAGDGTPTCPPDFPVKGNGQSMIYHQPGQSSYAQTVAEFCFASAEAAEAAGFRQSRSRGQRAQK